MNNYIQQCNSIFVFAKLNLAFKTASDARSLFDLRADRAHAKILIESEGGSWSFKFNEKRLYRVNADLVE